MRTPRDRIRHAILFEAIALTIVTPAAAWIFGLELHESFVVIALSATVAMAWNYVFNLAVDRLLVRLGRSTYKTPPMRVLHAIAFEAGLILALVPVFMAYLQIGVGAALAMNLGVSAFYVVYAMGFNWAYDRAFPLPEWQGAR